MNSLGIIAEYNPFHKGHAYHIAKAREITGADCVIVIMSGNFVQRGEPAVMNKYVRTRAALLNGADIVIELPVVSAVGSARYFAMGSIGILKNMKAEYLCFGSEAGEITPFRTISGHLAAHREETDSIIHDLVREGISYPLARSRAMEQLLNSEESTVFLSQPNNILGLEYCLEIANQNASISPVTIARAHSNYHDTRLGGHFSSAHAIRNAINSGEDAFWDSLPENTHDCIRDYFDNYAPVFIDDFTDIVRFKLTEQNRAVICRPTSSSTADLPDFLLNKLLSAVENTVSATQLIEAVKSKDLTYTRISRALMHMILGLTDKNYANLKNNPCPYIRVLGFNKTGQSYLSAVRKELNCPLIVKPADYKEYLTEDIYASDIYNLILSRKSGRETISDYRHEIIRETVTK